MSVVEKWVPVAPDEVWAILAEPSSYAFWVVGSHSVDAVEGDWPQPGATFHHTQGHGPLKLSDTTTVVEAEPGRRLLLDVRARPLVAGPVELILEPSNGGTCIRMFEKAERGLARWVPHLLTDPMLGLRNADALRRLAAMAWARAAARGAIPAEPT